MPSSAYLDNNATTFLDPRVFEAMQQELLSISANPSSLHSLGRQAKSRMNQAREQIAAYCHAKPQEIIFSSGGTESMNLLIKGLLIDAEGHILSSNTEHSCVQAQLLFLEKKGYQVTYLPSGLVGAPKIEEIEKAILPTTKLLVFTAVNSETGVKIDLNALASVALQHKIPLVIDAVALLGKEPIHIPQGVTGMGFSGHKIHGPKGTGFAFLRAKTHLNPLFHGGGQEGGFRSGSENLPGIIGLAKAISLLTQELPQGQIQMSFLKELLEKSLISSIGVKVNGEGARICNVSNLSFPLIDAESLLIQLDMKNIQASHGSACSSGAIEPSRVLRQMGLSPEITRSSVRFSLSRNTTYEEILYTIKTLEGIYSK